MPRQTVGRGNLAERPATRDGRGRYLRGGDEGGGRSGRTRRWTRKESRTAWARRVSGVLGRRNYYNNALYSSLTFSSFRQVVYWNYLFTYLPVFILSKSRMWKYGSVRSAKQYFSSKKTGDSYVCVLASPYLAITLCPATEHITGRCK